MIQANEHLDSKVCPDQLVILCIYPYKGSIKILENANVWNISSSPVKSSRTLHNQWIPHCASKMVSLKDTKPFSDQKYAICKRRKHATPRQRRDMNFKFYIEYSQYYY